MQTESSHLNIYLTGQDNHKFNLETNIINIQM